MKVFTNAQFQGIYPVGVAAVVVAEDREEAAEYLRMSVQYPDSVKDEDMVELKLSRGQVKVLNNGNY